MSPGLRRLLRTGRKDDVPRHRRRPRLRIDRCRTSATGSACRRHARSAGRSAARVGSRCPLRPGALASSGRCGAAAKNHPGPSRHFKKAAELRSRECSALEHAGLCSGLRRRSGSSQEQHRGIPPLQPHDANALDSLGEIYYYEGRFPEAEKRFLEAFEMNNALLGGGELYRAALSRFLSGDQAKADEYFRRYIEFRQKHNDALVPLARGSLAVHDRARRRGPAKGRGVWLLRPAKTRWRYGIWRKERTIRISLATGRSSRLEATFRPDGTLKPWSTGARSTTAHP